MILGNSRRFRSASLWSVRRRRFGRKLVGFVREYLQANPQMRIELIPSELGSNVDYDFTVQSLRLVGQEQGFDEACRQSVDGMRGAELYRETWCARASATSPVAQLSHHWNASALAIHRRRQGAQSRPPSRFISFGSAVYRAAIDGFGIARLAAFLVNDDLKSGRLVKLLGQYSDNKGARSLSDRRRR